LRKAPALLVRIGQFAESIAQFQPADIQLEAFRQIRQARLQARQGPQAAG
jgi:hypothetical protein